MQLPDFIEMSYPLSFRKIDAEALGSHLKHRHAVVLVGMKRVGISNFLRYFTHRPAIVETFIHPSQKHLFIPVDLNDLVERELFPFWNLTLKRIADTVDRSVLPLDIKKEVAELFLESAQLKDLFFTIDSVRKSLMIMVFHQIYPTIFFLRFDRMQEAVTRELFNNLQGLKDATQQKLSYVFTSYRGLDSLSPDVFRPAALSAFAQVMYIKPAEKTDTEIISETYEKHYKMSLSDNQRAILFDIVDGYVQYLQLVLIILSEKKADIKSKDALFDLLSKDERILFQSEELWESLSQEEKETLLKIARKQKVTKGEKEKASYLFDTGMVGKEMTLFSPLFSYFLEKKVGVSYIKSTGGEEFTKKENMMFVVLKEQVGEICEREHIIEQVWPEAVEFGVSDWAVDRLVARVRSKLKLQKSPYEVQTVKTRGYKLISIR